MNNDIEKIVAKNLSDLRKAKKLKQSELADKIGYSDKTISRWENGSTVPDIVSLAALAEFYGITIDDLTKEDAAKKYIEWNAKESREYFINELSTLFLSVMTVWLIAVVIYVAVNIIGHYKYWVVFVWAAPISALLALRFNHANDNIRILNTLFLSMFVWGIVTGAYLQLLKFNLWQLFLIPIPLEIIIVIYTLIIKRKTPPPKKKRGMLNLNG